MTTEDAILRFVDISPEHVSSLLKILHNPVFSWLPLELEYHPGLTCPLNCKFCHTKREPGATSLYYRPRGGNVLSASVVEEMIRTFATLGGKKLVISGGLEPFTTERTVSAVNVAKQCRLEIWIYTNGLPPLLRQEHVRQLLVSSCKRIRVSLHAATPATFQRVEMPDSSEATATKCFDLIMDSLRGLLAERSRSPLSACSIGISFVISPDNIRDVSAILQLAEGLGLDFVDFRSDILGGCEQDHSIASCFRNLKGYSGNTHIDFERSQARDELLKPEACYAPLRRVVVNPWGEVYACCITAQSTSKPGAVLGEIETGSDLSGILKQITKRVPILPYCDICSDRDYMFNAFMNQRLEADEPS
jgi:MoaA/NifB/PqqE/SkfB family radical SAM enzyme